MEKVTQLELKDSLLYDPETGLFTWKITSGSAICGEVAGGAGVDGYIRLGIRHKRYLAHRLAWLYMYGVWPKNEIDHVNGDRSDNRICNLREATHIENTQNIGKRPNNKSGYIGVHWHKLTSKWVAAIRTNGKQHHLGLFDTPELAYEAYLQAKRRIHKFQQTPR